MPPQDLHFLVVVAGFAGNHPITRKESFLEGECPPTLPPDAAA
jgi:hypothetical protein